MQTDATMTNLMFVSSGMFSNIHSGLSRAMPSNGLSVCTKASRKSCGTGSSAGQCEPVVVSGASTSPST